jgi:hypothetical protein
MEEIELNITQNDKWICVYGEISFTDNIIGKYQLNDNGDIEWKVEYKHVIAKSGLVKNENYPQLYNDMYDAKFKINYLTMEFKIALIYIKNFFTTVGRKIYDLVY